MTYFDELAQVLSRTDPTPLLDFVRGCQGTLWLAGNGGSASIAQHWACDLSKAAGRRVQALGCNSAVLTAWANDEGYEGALARELSRLVSMRDRLIVLSCSGVSPNIVVLIDFAVAHRIPSMLVTGNHGEGEAFEVVRIPHTDYGILEDSMSAIGHWLTKELRM